MASADGTHGLTSVELSDSLANTWANQIELASVGTQGYSGLEDLRLQYEFLALVGHHHPGPCHPALTARGLVRATATNVHPPGPGSSLVHHIAPPFSVTTSPRHPDGEVVTVSCRFGPGCCAVASAHTPGEPAESVTHTLHRWLCPGDGQAYQCCTCVRHPRLRARAAANLCSLARRAFDVPPLRIHVRLATSARFHSRVLLESGSRGRTPIAFHEVDWWSPEDCPRHDSYTTQSVGGTDALLRDAQRRVGADPDSDSVSTASDYGASSLDGAVSVLPPQPSPGGCWW